MRNRTEHFSYEDILNHGQSLPVSVQAMLLSVFGGNSYKIVAQEHGVPVGTVKSRISRARARIVKIKLEGGA